MHLSAVTLACDGLVRCAVTNTDTITISLANRSVHLSLTSNA